MKTTNLPKTSKKPFGRGVFVQKKTKNGKNPRNKSRHNPPKKKQIKKKRFGRKGGANHKKNPPGPHRTRVFLLCPKENTPKVDGKKFDSQPQKITGGQSQGKPRRKNLFGDSFFCTSSKNKLKKKQRGKVCSGFSGHQKPKKQGRGGWFVFFKVGGGGKTPGETATKTKKKNTREGDPKKKNQQVSQKKGKGGEGQKGLCVVKKTTDHRWQKKNLSRF